MRQAILDAASGDAINFNIPTDDPGCTGGVCTITLASELTIDKSLTIQGRAANQLTVSGNNAVRVFNIASGNFDVTLSGLTIANGTSGFSHGDRDGGGISNNSTGTLNVTNSTLSGNTADAGGGIANGTGTVNVTNSTLSGNHAGFDGGGIANGTGTVNVTNSTLSGNSSRSSGGGITNFNGALNVTNSTLSGNFTVCPGDCSSGGINNTGTAIVKNTIIALNSAHWGVDVRGNFTSQGYNLIGKGDGSAGFTNGVNNDQVGTSAAPLDPLLGPLANNGGPTQTQALLAGSPAIDKGSPTNDPITGAPITTDQRGLPRPVDDPTIPNASGGDGSDIGAFEAQSCVEPPSGIVAWWAGDGNATDVQGGNNGTLQNGATFATGMVAQAFSFDGVDDYVEVPDSDLWTFGANDFTIELWTNFSAPGSGSIFVPGDIFIGNDEGPFIVNKWFFALGGGVLEFVFSSPTIGDQFLTFAPFAPNLNQWYHLAVRRQGNTFTAFVNGLPAGSVINTAAIPNPNTPLTIGQAEGIGFMNGRLDEVAIYNRALTEQELQAIFNAGSAGKCKAGAPPDFSVSCSPSSLTVEQGASGTSTCTVTSLNGFDSAVTLSCSGQPAGVTCDFSPNPVTPPADGSITSTLRVNVDSTVSPGSSTFQIVGSAASFTRTFDLQLTVTRPTADLSVTKTDSPDPVTLSAPHMNITYAVKVTNNGPSSATNVTLSDAVPDNSKFVSNSGAAGWSCTNPSTKGPDPKTGTITCTTSSLASGDSATFTILVEVKLKGKKPKSGTTITNRAMVSSSTSDPNTGNNSATATTRVIGK